MTDKSGDAVAADQGGSEGNQSDEGVAVSESDARDEANEAWNTGGASRENRISPGFLFSH